MKLTSNPGDVAGCKVLGEVNVEPSAFQTNAQGHDALRNAAYALGGDTVLQTSGGAYSGSGRFKGIAYLCQEAPKPAGRHQYKFRTKIASYAVAEGARQKCAWARESSWAQGLREPYLSVIIADR
ncbi:MAG TPA: hypothetical protein VJA16_20450 [Thermoanaerobaculia bacterium]